jgi:class I fructose-bisphosphate aldolase
MPVMVEPIAMRLPQGPEAVEVECHASRIAMELGADIIKVGYPGDVTIMKSLCDELGVPVVILGGPGTGTVTGLLRMVGDALAGGASGIVIGRKVWQQDQRIWTSLAKALVRMVHGGLTTDEAVDVLEAAG